MKRILIVEEALRDLKAHWFDYIYTIVQECQQKECSVEIACHQKVDAEIREALPCLPLFRYARYLDNHQRRLPGDRYYGFILHSVRSLKALWPLLQQQPAYDLAFAPTVLMHHLLAWWVIMTFHPKRPKQLTLFFVTNPGAWNSATQSASLPKSSALLGLLLRLFRGFIKRHQVTLAVETQGAKAEFEALSRLPFTFMPHPVPAGMPNETPQTSAERPIVHFACYGFARYEKGSDLLQQAIVQILQANPDFPGKFSIQWVDDFTLPDGSLCSLNPWLKGHPKVRIIDHPVLPEAYQALLAQTDCMLLPYRNSAYYARVSRVAIEAAYQGIPMVYSQGGWLADTVSTYGAGIAIADESVEELVSAIKQMSQQYSAYQHQASEQVSAAKQYFSAANFCRHLLKSA